MGIIRFLFLLVFFVHVSFIGYFTIYPELPTIEKYRVNLKDIEFPFIFRLCATEKKDKDAKYRRFGYKNVYNFFLGESLYNRSIYGWNGHQENGSTIKGIEGILPININVQICVCLFYKTIISRYFKICFS